MFGHVEGQAGLYSRCNMPRLVCKGGGLNIVPLSRAERNIFFAFFILDAACASSRGRTVSSSAYSRLTKTNASNQLMTWIGLSRPRRRDAWALSLEWLRAAVQVLMWGRHCGSSPSFRQGIFSSIRFTSSCVAFMVAWLREAWKDWAQRLVSPPRVIMLLLSSARAICVDSCRALSRSSGYGVFRCAKISD